MIEKLWKIIQNWAIENTVKSEKNSICILGKSPFNEFLVSTAKFHVENKEHTKLSDHSSITDHLCGDAVVFYKAL